MNIDLKTISSKVTPFLRSLRHYLVLIFFVVLTGMYGFLIFRINSLTNTEPSEDALNEKLKSVQRPRIDQGAADTIKKLGDQNIEVQTLLKQARENPFSE